ncbi:hypothetical protein BH23BAC3_BH23BAC3_19840 [soil metagenome]
MLSFRTISLLPLFLFTLISIAPYQQSHAQSKGITISGNDMDVTFTERMQHSKAIRAITTNEGSVDLMLTKTDLLIQFSDTGLKRIHDEINQDSGDSHFAAVIKSMVSSGVQTLLNRAMSIPLYEISEVSYSDGALIIRNSEGQLIFEDLEFDGVYVMKDFSRRDSRNFVADAERLLE